MPEGIKWIIVFIILIAAMQFFQPFALIALISLSYLILSDWSSYSKKSWRFLLIVLGAVLVSTIAYKISLDYWNSLGMGAYHLGEKMIGSVLNQPLKLIIRAVNPLAYWGAFHF